jgi:LysR family transcriptional regulator, regulator for bpeEF and oprC
MHDSGLVTIKLGTIRRYICAAPSYLARRGTPTSIDAIAQHDAIDMLGPDRRARSWSFSRGEEVFKLQSKPRVCVNEALTIHRLVINGAGIGLLSGYICGPEIEAGRLVRLLPEWSPSPVEVSIVFPSRRELAPTVRAFADYMKEVSRPGKLWLDDPLAEQVSA